MSPRTRRPVGSKPPPRKHSGRLLRDCIIGISALMLTKSTFKTDRPLFKLWASEGSSNPSYRDGIKYYTRAISKFRKRIADASVPTDMSPRTVLLVTFLFLTFELLQGNTEACDRLTAAGLTVLRGKLLQAGINDGSLIAASSDDAGVYEAEFSFAVLAAFNATLSPFYPLGTRSLVLSTRMHSPSPAPPSSTYGADKFAIMWSRVLASAVIWYCHVEALKRQGHAVYSDPALQDQKALILSRTETWVAATQERTSAATHPHVLRLLTIVLISAKVVCITMFCSLNPLDTVWDLRTKQCLSVIDLATSFLKGLPLAIAADKKLMIYDGLFPAMVLFARQSRDYNVRYGALEVARLLISPSSNWDVKAIFMGNSSIVALEEMSRDKDGCIPPEAWFEWTEASWSADYSELHMTAVRGHDVDGMRSVKKNLVLHPATYNLA